MLVEHEVEDEAVFLLTVTMDAAHALLQPHGIPRNVIVDHEPAELQVDAFAGGLGRHQDLSRSPELPLGVDACTGRVAVADLHAAVNLCDREAPLAEFPSGRPSLPSPAR